MDSEPTPGRFWYDTPSTRTAFTWAVVVIVLAGLGVLDVEIVRVTARLAGMLGK